MSPLRAKRPCKYPGCGMATRAAYCERHAAAGAVQERARTAARDRIRGSASARGYGVEWRRLRDRILAERQACELRLRGCTGQATEVHHLVPKVRGGTDAPQNLRAACRHCNRAQGARDRR